MQKIAVLASWLAGLVRGVRRRSQQAARRARLAARSSYKLEIGVLEDRIVPSTFTFTQLNYSVFPDYPDRPANRMTLESEPPEGGIIAVTRDTTGTAETIDYATAGGSVGEGVYAGTSGTLEFGTEDTTKYFDVAVTNAGTSSLFQNFLVHLFDPNDESETPTPLDTAVVTFFEPTYQQEIETTAADMTYHVAKNQTLSVDAHFGILANAYNPWGDYLTISAVSEVETDATLWYSSDGSFEYIPETDWTGTDTFTVTLNDGYEDTNTATITIVVTPTGESVECSSSIYFNYGGELQYTEPDFPGDNQEQMTSRTTMLEEELAVPTSQFTIYGNPFAPEMAEGICFVIPMFAATPIPEVQATTSVPLSENGPATVRSVFQDFKFADSVELAGHIGHVRQDLEPAIADLDAYFSNNTETAAVDRWFADSNDFGGNLNNGNTADIQAVYTAVAAGLDGNITTYRDNPTLTTLFGQMIAGRIEIGALYYNANAAVTPQINRYGTVIHELTHLYGNTTDHGYFDDTTSPWFWAQQTQMIWYNAAGDECVPLTTDDMIENADSYAGFLSQYYFHW